MMTDEDRNTLNRELIVAEYEMLTDQVDLRHQSWERAVQFGFSLPAIGIFYLELEHGDKPHPLLWLGLAVMLVSICFIVFKLEREIRSLGDRIGHLETAHREPEPLPYHMHVVKGRRTIPFLIQCLMVYSFPLASILYSLWRAYTGSPL